MIRRARSGVFPGMATTRPRPPLLLSWVLGAIGCAADDAPDEAFRAEVPVGHGLSSMRTLGNLESSVLQGGEIARAVMHAQVDHERCPYDGYDSPCTAVWDFDVGCVLREPGPFELSFTAEALSPSSNVSAFIELDVTLADRTIHPIVIPELRASQSPPRTPSLPCGGAPAITIED